MGVRRVIIIKKLNKYVASFLVALSIISISNVTTKAAFIDTVLYRWDNVSFVNLGVNAYDTNHAYKDITFRNGYNYTQSSQDVTSLSDRIGGIAIRLRYTRTFSTY